MLARRRVELWQPAEQVENQVLLDIFAVVLGEAGPAHKLSGFVSDEPNGVLVEFPSAMVEPHLLLLGLMEKLGESGSDRPGLGARL